MTGKTVPTIRLGAERAMNCCSGVALTTPAVRVGRSQHSLKKIAFVEMGKSKTGGEAGRHCRRLRLSAINPAACEAASGVRKNDRRLSSAAQHGDDLRKEMKAVLRRCISMMADCESA